MRWVNEEKLIALATEIAAGLGDHPDHTVAAAAIDLQGRVYSGVNDHHFTGGPCAELVVLGVAAAAQASPLAAMVAVGDGGRGVLAPCGRCRQILWDQHPDIVVLVPVSGEIRSVPIARLLPYAFEQPGRGVQRFLRFAGRYYDDIVAGRKRLTRRYLEEVPVGESTFVFEYADQPGFRLLPGVVEDTRPIRLDQLSAVDRDALLQHYPKMPADAELLEAQIRARD